MSALMSTRNLEAENTNSKKNLKNKTHRNFVHVLSQISDYGIPFTCVSAMSSVQCFAAEIVFKFYFLYFGT